MKSYLKFLYRNKLYTAIEAVGLVVSLAFVIIQERICLLWVSVVADPPRREDEPGGGAEKGVILYR